MSRYGYDEPPLWMTEAPLIKHLGTTSPVAAKDHTCSVCKKVIAKGTKHEKEVFRDDEQIPPKLISLRSHMKCLFGDDRTN